VIKTVTIFCIARALVQLLVVSVGNCTTWQSCQLAVVQELGFGQ